MAERSTRPRPHRRRGLGARAVAILTFGFLYVPIVVVVVMSVNAGDSLFTWSGFSLRWYGELFQDDEIARALGNTAIVALGSTAIACTLGTALAYGIHRYTRGGLIRAYTVAPAMLPDLLLAIGLLSVYSLTGFTLGLLSVVFAHAVFTTAIVTAVVLARMASLDPSLEEASRDLGAGPVRTFLRITLPDLAPGILAGALLALTLSIDEFVIAYFTAAPTTPTLPILIYSMVRFGVSPEINALATALLFVSLVAVIAAQRLVPTVGRRR